MNQRLAREQIQTASDLDHDDDWIGLLKSQSRMVVGVVGGSGRLGSWLAQFLTRAGHDVRIVDTVPPIPAAGVSFRRCDLVEAATVRTALSGCTHVCHLAALHGAHLVAGAPRMRVWDINVLGTQNVLSTALSTGVERMVFASSTSVFGSGSPIAGPARVLAEDTPLQPEDVYDLSKVAAERLIGRYLGERAITLRFGRFFYPSQDDYQWRKLSTGLDVRDACQAVALALVRPIMSPIYCVASDLPLSRDQRERLGFDAKAVLAEALPDLLRKVETCCPAIPRRVGKSVDTALLRKELGYRPERNLAWYFRQIVAGRADVEKIPSLLDPSTPWSQDFSPVSPAGGVARFHAA